MKESPPHGVCVPATPPTHAPPTRDPMTPDLLSSETILEEAEFNPKVKSYWLLSGTLVCVLSVVGIVLLPFWLVVGHWLTGRYLEHMRCVLTKRSLKVWRGILVRTEMTVPLDKITDLGLVEGPVMRWMDLQAVSIETAGQSTGGAAVRLVGVRNARAFRDTVMAQRERLLDEAATGARGLEAGPADDADPALSSGGRETRELLTEIRDVLRRIEGRWPPE